MLKLIIWLSGIILPLLIIFFIETFISTTDWFSTNVFAIFIIPVFWSPLWISLIVLWIIEMRRNKKVVWNENNNQIVYLNRDLKIASFLCSLVIGMMSFWFLTWGWWRMTLPVLINNYYYVLIIAIFVTIVSFIIIYKKFQKIEKNKPWFITEMFFNKTYKWKFNGIWYETFESVAKEITKESNNYNNEWLNEEYNNKIK